MGFAKPVNDSIYSIVMLLTEMTILLTYILFGTLLCLAFIVDIYKSAVNPFPRHFEKTVESTLDVIFVIFPTAIIIYLLIPSLGFIFNNEMEFNMLFSMDIVGHQWYWSYEYNVSFALYTYNLFNLNYYIFDKLEFDSLLDQETHFNRLLQVDKRVLLPINIIINAKITSQDVIHSWAVPQLGIKVDAIPGRIMNFSIYSNSYGVFYGQCSELCGVNHAFMPIVLQFIERDIFLDWLLMGFNFNPSKLVLSSLSLNRNI